MQEKTQPKTNDELLNKLIDLEKLFGEDIVVTISVSKGKITFENTFRKQTIDTDIEEESSPGESLQDTTIQSPFPQHSINYFG